MVTVPEPPHQRPAGVRETIASISSANISVGLVSFLFASTGPVALVIAAAAKGNLGETEIAAWLFGAFVLNSVFTIVFSAYFRQPLVFLFTMPGTVLVGQALTHMSFAEVVGAYLVTGVIVLGLGLARLVGRVMALVPMPIVMGMVSGVFLQFGLDWVRAFPEAFPVACSMTVAFFAIGAFPVVARMLPPMIVALVVGIAAAWGSGLLASVGPVPLTLELPHLVVPRWSWAAIAELSVPLAITVVAIQNAQGIAVLSAAGHRPPVDLVATVSGIGALITAMLGTVSTCLAGAVTGILVTGVEREKQYISAIVTGLLAMAFGVCAPVLARLSLAAPKPLIATLAGLAMLRILETAFISAFKGPYSFGALIAFLVTLSGIPIVNIGAPFWGLVFGVLASHLVDERRRPR